MAVVGTILLLPVRGNLGRVHVQHHPRQGIDRLGLRHQFAVDPSQTSEVLWQLKRTVGGELLFGVPRPKPLQPTSGAGAASQVETVVNAARG